MGTTACVSSGAERKPCACSTCGSAGSTASRPKPAYRLGRRGDAAERQAHALASGARSATHARPAGSLGAAALDRRASDLVDRAIGGSGAPLGESERRRYEPRYGIELSAIRIYADANADAAARHLNARAFSIGRNVVFARGQYRPEQRGTQSLLAHELAHVWQAQAAGAGAVPVIRRDDGGERAGHVGSAQDAPALSKTRGVVGTADGDIVFGKRIRRENAGCGGVGVHVEVIGQRGGACDAQAQISEKAWTCLPDREHCSSAALRQEIRSAGQDLCGEFCAQQGCGEGGTFLTGPCERVPCGESFLCADDNPSCPVFSGCDANFNPSRARFNCECGRFRNS